MANFIAIRVKVGNAYRFGLCGGAAMLLLAGCKPVPLNEPAKTPDKDYRPAMTPTVQDLAVDRARLLRAMADAASAAASGTDDSSAQAALEGRQFILKMPIGCGPQSKEATGWTYDAASQRLFLSAKPDIDLAGMQAIGLLPKPDAADKAGAPAAAGEATTVSDTPKASDTVADKDKSAAERRLSASALEVEAVDGFWVPRPWMLVDSCPVVTERPAAVPEEMTADDKSADKDKDKAKGAVPETEPVAVATAPVPAFGIAHFYTAREPRTGRRGGQAYTITRRMTEGEQFDPASLRLVMRGRLGAGPSGKVIQCAIPDPDRHPRCIVSATFDRVSFENADGSVIYAQWGGG